MYNHETKEANMLVCKEANVLECKTMDCYESMCYEWYIWKGRSKWAKKPMSSCVKRPMRLCVKSIMWLCVKKNYVLWKYVTWMIDMERDKYMECVCSYVYSLCISRKGCVYKSGQCSICFGKEWATGVRKMGFLFAQPDFIELF